MTKSVGQGYLYQATYKSFLVESDKQLVDLIRYVEQNSLRAKLVKKAEEWQWSSLFRRRRGLPQDKKLLALLPNLHPTSFT